MSSLAEASGRPRRPRLVESCGPARSWAERTLKSAARSLTIRYACFAVVAGGLNLAAQAVVFACSSLPMTVYAALACGTVAGLVPKFFLDKFFIFEDRSTGVTKYARQFTVYGLLSGVTTLIFWATELLFDAIGHGNWLHYAGAGIGLLVGYVVKYRLDKHYTFVSGTTA